MSERVMSRAGLGTARLAFLAALSCVVACGTTVDSLGSGETERPGNDVPASVMLGPLRGPTTYPNPLRDLLALERGDIDAKIEETFRRLFEGDPVMERIYLGVGEDQGFVLDVLHSDVRTEGMGYAMMITVQLDKRDYFDRLWSYAKQALPYREGANEGYYRSSCMVGGEPQPCADPFGPQQFAMALIFAHGRWGDEPGRIDYAADALALLEILRDKERVNGLGDGVTNMFDEDAKLVLDVPETAAAGRTRPSIEMPAYYELWAQATGDAFWSDAAEAAREHWARTAHERTGLMPLRATFEGMPVQGSEGFEPESYRALINIALDSIWFGEHDWHVDNANRLLATFVSPEKIGTSYELNGTPRTTQQDAALVFAAGAVATIATANTRQNYLTAAWEMDFPTGAPRYYAGLIQLLSLLVMSGQYRVY